MGLFSDKLILKLIATSISSGKLAYDVEKIDHKYIHILPFSCISLIGSQLTVLTSQHSRSLSKQLLQFIENPRIQYKPTTLVHGFQLEIYEGRGPILYNQFQPNFTRPPLPMDDSRLEGEIEQTLLNHVITVYEDAGSQDKSDLQVFLLMTVSSHQQNIIPHINRLNFYDMENRKRLIRTVIDICTAIYTRWDNEKSIYPGNTLFMQHLKAAKEFDSY